MKARDDLLRAAVYEAYELRGKPGFRDACHRVVFVHRTWPLIEYAHAIETVENQLHAELEAELDWYEAIGVAA